MLKNIILIFSISLMAVVGIVAITPALPLIATDLNVPKEKIGVLVSAFTLPGIGLTPILGIFSDKFGRKFILLPSLFVLGFFSILSFFIRDFYLLIIFRFLSGIGAASLGAMNITLIGDLFNKDKREKIVGYNNSILNLGTTVFPFLAGILANFHWSLVFILPSLALTIFIWLLIGFKEKTPLPKTSENYVKNFLVIIKNKDLSKIFLINFLTYVILFGSLWTYLPLLMAQKFSSQPFVIGITLSSMSLTTSIFSLFFGTLAKKISSVKLFSISFTLYAIALFTVTFVPEWHFLFIATVLFGIGHGVNLPNIQAIVIRLAPQSYRAGIIFTNRTISQLGQTVGPLVSTGILFLFANTGLAINFVFYFSAVLGILLVIFSQFVLKNKHPSLL